MALDNNLNLINQIVTASGLRGKDLEALKTRLSKMSEAELQRELSKALSGNNSVGDKGLVLERTGLTQPPEQSITQSKPQSSQSLVLKEQQSKEVACAIIDENLREAEEVFRSQHLGSISGAYDEAKDENDKLKTSNVAKVLGYQQAGFSQIVNAKNGKLTRREYYEENKQRIKDMILTRLNVFKTPTGITFLEQFRGEYSKDEIVNIVNAYIEQLCSNASMEKLKEIQNQFVSYNQVEEAEALINFINSSKEYHTSKNNNLHISAEDSLPKIKGPDVGIVPSYWDSAEPISFEEVYKLERGVEYSQQEVESYIQSKSEMENVISAFNKKQQFIDFTDALRNEDLSLAEKESKLYAGFAEFYALSEDGGLSQLQKIIDKSNLPIMIVDGKLNLEAYPDEASKIRALNQLLRLAGQEKEKEFEAFLGNATIEDYQLIYEQKASDVLGEENGKLLAEAMANDNMSMIQRYTGNTSMVGMGLTVVGGILCFTPAAPLGAVLVTAGNTVAIGGMVAKTGLGVTDYATKEVQTQEELENLAKDFVMDAGGFIIGMKAGQTGLKAFSKLIDKKLVAVFGEQVSQGNKLQALKTVFTTPEYLASFSKAAGAKISTDFLISYIGDLAMMGVLDTRDDWKSLLQANLTGILVGMSGDVKDVAGVGKVRHNLPETIGTKSRPESRVIVTSDEAVVTNKNTPTQSTVSERLATASAKEDFIALRDEIKSMPEGAEKTALKQEYVRKYKEYSQTKTAENDVKAEAKPEEPANSPKLFTPEMSKEEVETVLKGLTNPDGSARFKDFQIENILDIYTPNKSDLLNKLLDAKYADGSIRFVNREIEIILQSCTPDNVDVLNKLLEAKDSDGSIRFNGYHIRTILESYTPDKADALNKLLDGKNQDGSIRFVCLDIEKILNSYTPEKADALNKLLDALDSYGFTRFNGYDIVHILNSYTPYKAEVLDKLLEAKDLDGSTRFQDSYNIMTILKSYTPDKADVLNKLLEAKYSKHSARFNDHDIEKILNSYTTDKADVFNKLLEAKDLDGSTRFNGYGIEIILKSYTPDKAEILNKLLDVTNLGGSRRFGPASIETILKFYTPDKAEILDKLLEVKNPNGSNRFVSSDIGSILQFYTPEKADALNKLLEAKDSDDSPRFDGDGISIILREYTPNKAECLQKLLNAKNQNGLRFNKLEISNILENYTPDKAEILTRLLSKTVQDPQGNTIPRFDADIIRLFLKRPELEGKIDEIVAKVPATEYGNYALRTFLIKNNDIDIDLKGLLKFKDLDSIIKMIQNNPERYINGTETDPYAVKIIIDDFFRHFGLYLSNLNTVLDKEAMNTLLRTRLSNVQTYLYTTTGFSSKEWELLGKLANSCNNDGKPFLPKQKIQFIDLIKAYKDNDVSFNKMEQMLETGNIDVGQLQIDLFQNVMRKSGLTEEEIAKIPNENIMQWDIQNIHLLAKSINSDKKAFDDIIRAANLEKDFVEYLHNADNVYGQANKNTQKMYADMKMDYDEWLHPSKNHEIKFTAKDKNLDKVQQIASQVEEDLNALMNTPVSGFLKKQFPKFIKDNKFVLPAEYTNNKAKLTEFVKLLADTSEKGQLAQVWKRAQGNSTNSNPEIAARANNTLTILNHLEQRVKDIESVQEIQSTKTLDITIKMWDRVPQKDLFQGNYSTCCIGMSDSNASAMPHFIMDTSYNMIELVDNNSGDVIGNALCYFVKGEDGKPAFVIDNIEINNAHKPSDEIGADLRDHIAAYAARVAKDVTGADNTPIYMSSSYNDVPISDLKSSTQEVSFLGDIDCDEIYMDLYKGWVDKKDLTRKVGLLKVEPALVKEDYGTNFAKRLEMGTIKPIPEGLLNVKISDVIVRDGDKVSLKPEYEKQLWIIAENIRDNALKMEDKIVKLIEDNNFKIAGAEFKHRPKSLQSLYDKMKNYIIDNANTDKKLQGAYDEVRDAVGVRVIAPSMDYSNHPEVKALLAAGKKNEAIALATEMQSKEIVANLKRISEDENHELKLINISNYKSKNGVPYAKAKDVEYLKYHGSDNTSKSGKDDKSIRDDLKGETKTESESSNNFKRTKVRNSGYTALQTNFMVGNFIFEFQFRGKEVDEFAEGEHIPYDLRTGKDIIGKDTQLKVLYEPMKDLLRVLEDDSTETVGMTDVQYKTYEGYLSKYYEYLRAKELGIAIDKPKFPTGDFPRDKRLMAENLIKLHNIAERLKKNEITPTEALREYQSEMVELE